MAEIPGEFMSNLTCNDCLLEIPSYCVASSSACVSVFKAAYATRQGTYLPMIIDHKLRGFDVKYSCQRVYQVHYT